MARLPLTWEKQHGLFIFMLQSGKPSAIKLRHVMVHLSRRVRVELMADFVGCHFDLIFVSSAFNQSRHSIEMLLF